MLARQRPEEGADFGAFEEVADGVDAHAWLAEPRRVPHGLELPAHVLAQVLVLLALAELGGVRRQAFTRRRQAVGENVQRVEPLSAELERLVERGVHVGLAIRLDRLQPLENSLRRRSGIVIEPAPRLAERIAHTIGEEND